MNIRHLIPVLFSLLIANCGGKKDDQLISPGGLISRPKTDLIRTLGEPMSELESPAGNERKLLEYENNRSFQTNNTIVEAEFREPTGQEATLLYWQLKWENEEFEVREFKSDKEARPLKQYTYKSKGVSLIYNPQTDQIERVMHHEKN